jgi:hypothetical protein
VDPKPNRINTQHPRCIYLGFLSNKEGGHELLDPWTGPVITRKNVSLLTMTEDFIDLFHALVDRDKMPSGLNITTTAGIVLHDTASIAEGYKSSDYTSVSDPSQCEACIIKN